MEKVIVRSKIQSNTNTTFIEYVCVNSYHVFVSNIIHGMSNVYLEKLLWWINREILWSTHWIGDLLTLTFVVPLYFHYSTENIDFHDIVRSFCWSLFSVPFFIGLFSLHMQYMRETEFEQKKYYKIYACHIVDHQKLSFPILFTL